MKIRVPIAQKRKRRAGVLHFPGPFVVRALAEVHAAKVKPQHYVTGSPEPPRNTVNNLVMHGPAIERVGVAHETGSPGSRVVGFFEQRFKPAGRPRDEVRLDTPRHPQFDRKFVNCSSMPKSAPRSNAMACCSVSRSLPLIRTTSP